MPTTNTTRREDTIIRPPANTEPSPSLNKIILHKASDIEPVTISWLWYPYIPAGKLTMLEGDPGMGKSMLTCALAADISTGRALPGQDAMSPQKVLMVSQEDGMEETIVPRLIANKANLENIFLTDSYFILDDNGIRGLEEHMREVSATIVFMDPLVAYMGGRSDINKANEMRALMAPLGRAAQSTGTAIVAVRHFRKAAGGKAIHRGTGSIDLTGVVRSAIQVDESKGGTKFLYHAKHNLSIKGNALAYHIDRENKFYWDGVFRDEDVEVPAISTKPFASAKAEQFLQDCLKDGPVEAVVVTEKAITAGISISTLNRVKVGLAHSRKVNGEWMWELKTREGIDP